MGRRGASVYASRGGDDDYRRLLVVCVTVLLATCLAPAVSTAASSAPGFTAAMFAEPTVFSPQIVEEPR